MNQVTVHECQVRATAGHYEAFARGSHVRLFNSKSAFHVPQSTCVGTITVSLRAHGEVTAVASSTHTSIIAAAANPGATAGVDGHSGIVLIDAAASTAEKMVLKTLTHSGHVCSPVFSPHKSSSSSSSSSSTERNDPPSLLLAYAYDNNLVIAHNTAGGMWREKAEKALCDNFIVSVAWSPKPLKQEADAGVVAVASKDGKLKFVDVDHAFEILSEVNLLVDGVSELVCIDFNNTGTLLAAGVACGDILVCDAETGEIKYRINEHRGPISSVRFSPDGSSIVSASADNTFRVFPVGKTAAESALRCRGVAQAAAWINEASFVGVTQELGAVQIYMRADSAGNWQPHVEGAFVAGAPAACLAWNSTERAAAVGSGHSVRFFYIRPPAVDTVSLDNNAHVHALSVAKNGSVIRCVPSAGKAAAAAAAAAVSQQENNDTGVKFLLADARDRRFRVAPRCWPKLVTAVCKKCNKDWSDNVPKDWECDCSLDKKKEKLWQEDTKSCARCGESFGFFFTKGSIHHARCCGRCVCAACSKLEMHVWGDDQRDRVCLDCLVERGEELDNQQ